jgi:Fe-S oxidoreductase
MGFVADPNRRDYLDPAEVERECRRVFDICHDCRRCYNLCPSFTTLLDSIDAAMEGRDAAAEVSALLPRETIDRVVDECFQCKLCDPHCPYTPPHRFEIDFPRLMLRAKASRARQRGLAWVDRVLGNPERLGRLGCRTARLANWANRTRWLRIALEKILGVHRDRLLPRYASESFESWFRRRGTRSRGQNGRVVLFYTCAVNFYDVDVGKACVQVLERNGFAVECPPQSCCGMPALDGGDVDGARRRADRNVRSLAEAVARGCAVVVPNPTCSYTLKRELPLLCSDPGARAVAERTFDICEFLVGLHREGRLDTNFVGGAGRVAYQVPCHLRVQNIGFKSRDLLRLLPQTEVELIERCAGVDGTWGFKKEWFDLSLRVARSLFRDLENAGADTWASDCSMAALQVEQRFGRKPEHPIQIVRRAYGLEPEG